MVVYLATPVGKGEEIINIVTGETTLCGNCHSDVHNNNESKLSKHLNEFLKQY